MTRFYPRYLSLLSLATLGLGVAGCDTIAPPVDRPDLRITVQQNADGSYEAIPPECPDWSQTNPNPFDNQPHAQFGCASAHNLAAMVEDPKDLIKGRPLGRADGELAASTIQRYRGGAPKILIDPKAPSPVAQQSLREAGLK